MAKAIARPSFSSERDICTFTSLNLGTDAIGAPEALFDISMSWNDSASPIPVPSAFDIASFAAKRFARKLPCSLCYLFRLYNDALSL
jgi:hypothetical protein